MRLKRARKPGALVGSYLAGDCRFALRWMTDEGGYRRVFEVVGPDPTWERAKRAGRLAPLEAHG